MSLQFCVLVQVFFVVVVVLVCLFVFVGILFVLSYFCFVVFVRVYASRLISSIPLICAVKENGLLSHIPFYVNIRFFGQCIIIYYNRSHYLKVNNYAKIITLIPVY